MGIIPLYMGWDQWGNFYVASELKALEGICNKIQEFLPGHYLYSKKSYIYNNNIINNTFNASFSVQ